MGTRGAIGWRKDGVEKIAYNHFDSYPEELGVDMLKYACRPVEALTADFNDTEMIDDEVPPTDEQIERCHEHESVNLDVSEGKDTDWYCLLRDVQGKLQETAEVGFMIDYSAFLEDSLFCEWAYIVNLDTKKLEVYRGFQKGKPGEGRYAELICAYSQETYKEGEKYYGVGLLKEYDLAALPEATEMVKELNALDPHGEN